MAILGQSAKLNVRQSVFCCLIAKLNVRQMYHLYGILYKRIIYKKGVVLNSAYQLYESTVSMCIK